MDLDERDRIRLLTAGAESNRNVLGFGDDCAAIPSGADEFLLLSTDMTRRETHFPPQMTPPEMGAYLVNAGLSDVAAMGGEALGLLLAAGLPAEADAVFIEGLRNGVLQALRDAGTELLGGDTKPAPEITLVGTAVGRVPRDEILTRRGARPGDLLAVTGTVGGAGAGLHALGNGMDRNLADRLLRPRARLAEGRALAAARAATAAMDLSDGLALGVHDLARASGTGAIVHADRVPVDAAALQVDETAALEWAVFSGGDFELLAAVPPEKADEAARAAEAAGGTLTVIGRLTPAAEGVQMERAGRTGALPARGFIHFKEGG